MWVTYIKNELKKVWKSRYYQSSTGSQKKGKREREKKKRERTAETSQRWGDLFTDIFENFNELNG